MQWQIKLCFIYNTQIRIIYIYKMSRNEREFGSNYRNYPTNNSNYNRYTNDNRNYRSGIAYSPHQLRTYEAQPYGGYNQMHRSNAPKSSSSKLADLNQRLVQQTEMIRMRGLQRKNYDTRSTSSREDLKRSRHSADGQRRSPFRHSSPIGTRDYYHESPHSLSNSRHSQQILSRPIITHSLVAHQPILTNSRTQNYYPIQLPSFKKVDTRQPIESYLGQPILPAIYTSQNNQGRSMFQEVPQNSTNIKSILKKSNNATAHNDDSIEQFLDMDFKPNTKKPSMQSVSSLPDSNYEAYPVSPVTGFYNIPLMKKPSEKLEPQSMKSIRYDSPTKKAESLTRVPNMFQRVDFLQGKLITAVLIGIGLILVIFQAIK